MKISRIEDLLRDARRSPPASHITAEQNAIGPLPTHSLVPLLRLRRELAELVAPAPVRPEFRAELHRNLVASARQQQARQALDLFPAAVGARLAPALGDRKETLPPRLVAQVEEGWGNPQNRPWIMGAAVGSAVSVAGLLAYMLRHRGRRAA